MSDRTLSGVRTAVLTVSDRVSRGEAEDSSGPAACKIVQGAGGSIVETGVVSDDRIEIAHKLRDWAESKDIDLVVTTGGTGVGPRDVTPEATADVCDKAVPGIAEQMRAISLAKTPHAALSRAMSGIARQTLIVNLPGSAGGVTDCLSATLPALGHAIGLLKGAETPHLSTTPSDGSESGRLK